MTSSDNTNTVSSSSTPDHYAQREAFTQSLLRWQSESPTYGLGSALSPTTPGAPVMPVSPAQALSDIIRVAGARMPLWDQRRLTGAAHATHASERPTEQGASFYTNVAIMNLISHAIEERIIAERRPCDIYAGFQRLALVRPQLRRYRALSEVTRYVYLFGIDDSAGDADIHTLGPGVTLRFDIKPELGTGLEHFWFVVVDDPRMPTALLAQHTEGDIWSPRQATRSFTGVWTFDRALVSQIIAILRRGARILYYNNPAA
ncbi:MAG TPA: DICT sensory domain-containing protein [Ktedonobacterales bacterium]|jgi:DICT domain-containing protein|nr:DICT sensory domain-containing protein [Ktedonobacterales bacterium]